MSVIKDSNRARKYEELLKDIGTIDEDLYKRHDIKIQDRYSLRCAPHINGALRDTLYFTKNWIENELNSSNDNPLIDEENNIIYNSGNFYGGHITLAADYLRVALANISDLAEKQSELIIDGKFNNLTANLIPFINEPSKMGLFHGFKAAQITMTALTSEINFLSAPVSVHSRPTESLNQDKVSLGTISIRKLREQIELLYMQYAVHIMALSQAMDLINVEKFGSFSKKVYKEVRKISKFVSEDRALDIEAREVVTLLKEENLFF
jgi:histidine ammonia-lyase/phenylalanine ammonia-lyase